MAPQDNSYLINLCCCSSSFGYSKSHKREQLLIKFGRILSIKDQIQDHNTSKEKLIPKLTNAEVISSSNPRL